MRILTEYTANKELEKTRQKGAAPKHEKKQTVPVFGDPNNIKTWKIL